MIKSNLQNTLGVFLIVSHFGVILSVLLLWVFDKGFDFNEMIDGVSIMAPMFAVYSTAILAYLLKDKPAVENGRLQVSGARLFISLFIPGVFILALILIIMAWVQRKMELQQFKVALAARGKSHFGENGPLILKGLRAQNRP